MAKSLPWLLIQVFLVAGLWLDHANSACPVVDPKKCSCAGIIMDCNGRGLTSVPAFKQDSTINELHLEGNAIVNITDNDFKLLTQLTRVNLRNNSVSMIENDAFAGMQQNLGELNLGYNQLEELPVAIGTLDALHTLDVSFNPIVQNQFTDHVMYEIGDTLNKLTIGSVNITAWPETLRHLQALNELRVLKGSFFTIPPDAFHGFEGTLEHLTMEHTLLIALPLAVSNLRWLNTLHFDHNYLLGDSGVLIPSFGNRELLPQLRTISLVDDNLTVFPSLLRYLKQVDTLILDSNRLAFVSDASVQVAMGTKITTLSLRNCSLSRVPGALSKLTNLTNLNLASNNIHSFENKDFENMANLRNLTILDNPLEYIANETFKDLLHLEHLNLMNTKIKQMPEAIRFLKNLKELRFPEDSIECTCHIAWLKEFMLFCDPNLHIEGSCETILSTIAAYLNNHIPNCPNYDSTVRSCNV